MATFGDGVSALLETYTKCLRLLKSLGAQDSDWDSARATLSTRLRDSIQSDRAQVRRAYSTSLKENGRRLEKGDSRSRSVLRRILERLKTAMESLLSMARRGKSAIDYESLVSLSNGSRVSAIKTMSRLSQRLNSLSSLSREDLRSPPPENKDGDKHQQRSKSVLRRGHTSGSSTSSTGYDSTESKGPQGSMTERRKKKSKKPGVVRKQCKINGGSSAPSPTGETLHTKSPSRVSYISMSSDSTQLGEIPCRSRQPRLVRPHDGNYNVSPVYPLHAYPPTTKEKRGLLKRIFGASQKARAGDPGNQ